MRRSLANTCGSGIEDAGTYPMKMLRPVTRCGSEERDKKITRVNERPLRICVVFDEDASARSAEILISHAASDQCDIRSFRFDELDTLVPGVAAARWAADTDNCALPHGFGPPEKEFNTLKAQPQQPNPTKDKPTHIYTGP